MSAAEQLVVTLTAEQFAALVQQSVSGVVEKLVAEQQREVLDLEECAALLKRHPKIVMTVLVKKKGLPCHFISKSDPRFRRSEVLAWLNTLPTRSGAGTEG